MIPSYDKAIECGIKDQSVRIPGLGVVPSYKGSAYIHIDGRVYHAIGFPAVVVGNKLVSNGYIDIQRIKHPAAATAKKETSGFSLGRFLGFAF